MEELLELLKDGNTKTPEEIAGILDTTVENVKRQIEYLEKTGMIKSVSHLPTEKGKSCRGCSGCEGGPAACKGCIPPEELYNMGKVWEVVSR